MTRAEIKKRILTYRWHPWLEREFGAFVLSAFHASTSLNAMKRIGLPLRYPGFVFQNHLWYESDKLNRDYGESVADFLARRHLPIAWLTASCEKFHRSALRRIATLVNSTSMPIPTLLSELDDILGTSLTFVWPSHGLDPVYTDRLHTAAAPYANGNPEKFIGDLIVPTRKNAHARLEDALLGSMSLADVRARYGWLRVRNALADPFTIQELRKQREQLRRESRHRRIRRLPPHAMNALVVEARELVYYRTYRTEVFYELLHRARPLLIRIARHFSIPPSKIADCSILDLKRGRVIFRPNPTVIGFDGRIEFLPHPFIAEKTSETTSAVRGTVAFPGIATGRVVVVKTIADTKKVAKGNILVTQMTFPAFIMAMQRAAAFVTDEGGLTCHAAIVAREMHKPCIVGTKHATQVLKDGDRVEVDANKGIVTKLRA